MEFFLLQTMLVLYLDHKNLIDQLLIFRSGHIIGNDGIPFVNELNSLEMENLNNYKILSTRTFGNDVLEIRKLSNESH